MKKSRDAREAEENLQVPKQKDISNVARRMNQLAVARHHVDD